MIDSKGIPEYPVSPFLFQNHLPRKDHVIRVQGADGGDPGILESFFRNLKGGNLLSKWKVFVYDREKSGG
jgi:hypothetical protein